MDKTYIEQVLNDYARVDIKLMTIVSKINEVWKLIHKDMGYSRCGKVLCDYDSLYITGDDMIKFRLETVYCGESDFTNICFPVKFLEDDFPIEEMKLYIKTKQEEEELERKKIRDEMIKSNKERVEKENYKLYLELKKKYEGK